MKPGTRYFSTVCDTAVVVVKAPADAGPPECGGAVMGETAGPATGSPAAGLADGALLGKRYVDEVSGVELLVTKGGAGTLTVDRRAMTVKQANPLPSSD